MTYIKRLLGDNARKALARGKSILLLGARQTGKTTFIRQELKPDVEISLVKQTDRLRYEKNPELLENEILAIVKKNSRKPLIFIDEIQKIPRIMDSVQYLIDKDVAQFIVSGSSARKLKHGKDINLLPGRVVSLNLEPLTYLEIPNEHLQLEDLLLFGTLPAIITAADKENNEVDLASYVTTYLEDEIRTEAVVRNIGHFAQFLQLSAGESGKNCNMQKISQDVGVAATTISSYFQILVDCLIAHKIEPITTTSTKRKLIKTAKYLFFDLGIRRVCANEGTKLPARILGELFEQYVGLQLIAFAELFNSLIKVRYWRDSAGPEIDYVLEIAGAYIPIEVKWSDKPNIQDAKHVLRFLQEYPNAKQGFIISRTPNEYIMGKDQNITVLPWQQMHVIFDYIKQL
jgi:predicted AAA+ superfamily ATPase